MIQFVSETDRGLFEDALKFAQHQVRTLVETHPEFYPMYTVNGRWKHEGRIWTNWCDGFLPGMMWIFHKRNAGNTASDKYWLEQAVRYTTPLEPRQHDREAHDLGFIFLSTYYRWYRLTHDPNLRDVLIEAGKTEALRFQENGQYLRSFVGENSLFIDLMMNVGIVFYAARETGDRRLRDIALRHCLTTRRVLFRGDGSTAQEGIFDPETGEFLRQSAQQGYRGDSCWSRGQAWALYGFSVCVRIQPGSSFSGCRPGVRRLLHHAFQRRWQCRRGISTRLPKAARYRDTSAAAIAASGLLRLCRLLHDSVKGHYYWSTAILILRNLCQKHLARTDKKWEGILKGGVYHLHKELGVDESVMWGEYFFVEGLDQALQQLS